MITCRITIKIKDYFPKTDTIPYENYICIFSYSDYEDQIPFLPDESKIIQHQIKNITSDIKYKIHILDFNDMSLIGMCEMTILYDIVNQITPPNGFIQEQQKKLLIDLTTKRKLFGTIINTGDIFLNIYAEVYVISKSNIEPKFNKTKKNLYQNTPQCFIKYNFQINKSEYSPKTIKNKSLLNISNSGRINFNSKRDKINSNKNSNNNYINFKSNRDKDKENDDNIKNYSTFNNSTKKGIKIFSNKKQQNKYSNNNAIKQPGRKTIMDLLEDKKMKEKKFNKDKKEKENKSDIESDSNNILINKKEGYLTEQNVYMNNEGFKNDNKYIINNHKLKKINKEEKLYNNYDKILNNDFHNITRYKNNTYNIKYKNNLEDKENITDDGIENNKLDNLEERNIFSPKEKINKNEVILNNLNKNAKINKNIEGLNNKYIYNSKNKIIKMGKNFKRNNINLNRNSYNPEETEKDYINKNNSLLSSYSNDEVFLDIDKIILEKGAELRNDFIMQLKPYISNKIIHYKNLNSINEKYKNAINKEEVNQINSEGQQNLNNNNNINDNNTNNNIIGRTKFYLETPRTEKISQISNNQKINNTIYQENVKNNCLKLIEFYSLLNFKLKKINPKNVEIKKKLIIFKELLSNQFKKNNNIVINYNLIQFINYITTSINQQINEKILYLFPKIKKLESTLYQFLFDTYYTEDEVIKFKEYENYDEQTKIFLLLTIAKTLINKYGNISQIFEEDNNKKNLLKQCFEKYDLVEKREDDKDFINLEELSNELKLKNQNGIKDLNGEIDNKFKVIKEVDEDKEEENEEEDEEIKIEKNKEIIEDFVDNDESNINKDNIHEIKHSENSNNNEEEKLNENMDIKIDEEENVNVDDLIEKILIEEFNQKYKDSKYFFKKIGLNEYLYNNIKIKATLDKEGYLKIILDDKNEEYNFNDFIKLFSEDESEDNKIEIIKNNDNIDYVENIDSKKNSEKNFSEINDINDENINKDNIDINDENEEKEIEDENDIEEKIEYNFNNENEIKK